MVDYSNNCIIELLDRFAPLRQVRTKVTNDAPWFGSAIRRAILMRDVAFRRWRNSRSDICREQYCSLRNSANRLIRDSKRQYYASRLQVGMGSKTLWKNLRSMGLVSSRQVEPHFNANDFAKYLSDIDRQTANMLSSNNVALNYSTRGNSFSFVHVTELDVLEAFHKVKSNAIGLDGVPFQFVKLILPVYLPYLMHIFNHCITTSTFPLDWKIGKIIPCTQRSQIFQLVTSDQLAFYLSCQKFSK